MTSEPAIGSSTIGQSNFGNNTSIIDRNVQIIYIHPVAITNFTGSYLIHMNN